ncbi:hypothetical protein K438DRAFT_1753399 [Mycena galopus ATCC 62051]|nr:hypothetical protein K438DRAFT_1753399 [Mycena galopus ATCC 62051]
MATVAPEFEIVDRKHEVVGRAREVDARKAHRNRVRLCLVWITVVLTRRRVEDGNYGRKIPYTAGILTGPYGIRYGPNRNRIEGREGLYGTVTGAYNRNRITVLYGYGGDPYTLSRVSITCYSAAPSAFQQIWHHSFPSIRSLHLLYQNHPETFEPILHQCAAPVNLEVLHISCMEGVVAGWLQHETCPFKFSNLKVLSVGQDLRILRWTPFLSARRKIEALELEVEVSADGEFIDLSLFPKLSFLRISATLRDSKASSKLIDIISAIPPSSNLREVVIHGVVEEESVCSELDSALVRLLMHPSATVELAWTRLEPLFPQLRSRVARNQLGPSLDFGKNVQTSTPNVKLTAGIEV